MEPSRPALVTEGGFKQNGEWVDVKLLPIPMLRRSWQYHLLTDIKASLDDTPKSRRLIHSLFQDYQEGCYVHAKDTIDNKRQMVKYIGKYIRHPTVAECRIESYDGEEVKFWYVDDEEVKHWVTMSVSSSQPSLAISPIPSSRR